MLLAAVAGRCRWPAPGIVVFHSTVDQSIEEPAGIDGPSPKALGLTLAEQGFVAFCPRNFLWRGTRTLAMRWQTFKFRCRHPRSKGMAKMLHDLLGGDGYDGARSQPFIEAALPVYRLYGSPDRLALYNHGRGHSFPPEAAARISQWLQTYA